MTVSVGGFVPKPFTPFQWFGQNTREELSRKMYLLRDELRRDRGVQFKWHDPKATVVEGIASRGDRRLGPVIEDVWRDGGTFQEWSEFFDLDLWTAALERHGLSLERYVYRHRTEDEVLPWDHISRGIAQGLPVAGLARRARPRSGSKTAGGRLVTTAVRAPATASSTSSRRRFRRPAAAKGPGRIASRPAKCRSSSCRRGREIADPVGAARDRAGADADPAAIHQGGQGPLHQSP